MRKILVSACTTKQDTVVFSQKTRQEKQQRKHHTTHFQALGFIDQVQVQRHNLETDIEQT